MAEAIRTIHIHHMRPDLFRDALAPRLPDRELVCWTSDEEFVRGIEEAEVILAFRPPRGHWARAGRLRLLQMSGAGVDALLPAPDLPSEVRIANARGIHGGHMAEFALAMILAFEKRIPTWFEEQRARRWKYHRIDRVRGKTVTILGLGAIGVEVARLCSALGMRVLGTRRGAGEVDGVDRVVGPERTAEVLAEADFAVVLLPLTAETRNAIDGPLLDALPEGAVLVNLARGGIVDEEALRLRLESGRLRGAALDVFAEEPLPEDDPLWEAPNTILTPHLSGWFPGYADQLADIFVHNLGCLERGEPLRNEIDRERGY